MASRVQPWVALGGLLLSVIVVEHAVFENGFVYDDIDMIEWGEVIHDPSQIWTLYGKNTMYAAASQRDVEQIVDTYRPVTMMSFFWDSALSGRHPWAYHLTNLAMHLLCTTLVFAFVRLFLGREAWPFALLGAAWFAFSPHANTAHIWINGRSDLFVTFFGLAAVLLWRHAVGLRDWPRALLMLASSALFFLGLLSKEVLIAALLPLLLWPDSAPDLTWARRIARCGGFVVAVGVYLALRAWVLGGTGANVGAERTRTAIAYLAPLELEGLLGALYPRRLYLRFISDEFAALTTTGLVSLTALVLLIATALFVLRRRLPLVSWGVLWFASCLAPVAIIAAILWPGFGRYLYLPSVGLAVALASLAQQTYARLPRMRAVLVTAAAVYLGVLALSVRGWIRDFRSEETLYLSTIAQNPEGAHGYGWLGLAHAGRGRFDEAVGPLAVAHRLAPDVPRYPLQLLQAFIQTDRLVAAHNLAEEAVTRYEGESEAFHLFLLDRSHMSDPRQATFQALECLRKAPGSTGCGEAFTHLMTQHPRREAHLAAAHAWLQEPEFSDVRRQTAPLIESLP